MIVSQYLDENKDWIGEDDANSICQIADTEWPAVLAALDKLNGGSEPGIDCSVAITHETVEDFDNSMKHHWRECGDRIEYNFDGVRAVEYKNVQLFKGQTRFNQMIVDLGKIRVCLS